MNVMNSMLSVSQKKRVYGSSSGSSGKKTLQRPEQKLVELIEDLVSKFFMAGELFVLTCPNTFVTAKAC